MGEKSIWDIAIEQAHVNQDGDSHSGEEASVLFLGSKTSGKTSIIQRFLERDEVPKITTALEYTFARKAKGHNIAKDIAHVWELGGGTWLSKLIDIPINPDTVRQTAVAIVLDLSKPNELWFTLEKLLNATKGRIEACIKDLKTEDPNVKQTLQKSAMERVGLDHPDKDMLDPFLIPLVIFGGKYDIFQDFDSEKKKTICKTLRFVAHIHGAHLQFFSTKQESLTSRARGLMTSILFNTPFSNTQFDHNKPLVVQAGQDSLQQIGSPPLPDGNLGKIAARTPLEVWKQAYTGTFPQENISDPSLVEDPAKDPQYAQQEVDSMRAQKDEELERYRRLSERRMREASRRLTTDGVM